MDDGTLEQMAYAFSCIVFISVSDGWSGNVLVKCFNDVFLSVCAPNSNVCWELLGYYWHKKKSILSFNFKPPASILFIVQIKDCAKSSLLIKCSLKTTWLHYPLKTFAASTPRPGLQKHVHNKLKQQTNPKWSTESWSTTHALIGLLFLYVNMYYV